MPEKIITPQFRGSFVALDKPKRVKGDDDGEPRFQILISLPKSDPFWKKMEAEVRDAAVAKFGKVPPKFKSPIKDGDTDGSEYENLAGCNFINASNNRRPGVVDAELNDIIDPNELYSGAWYRASIKAYAWDHPTGGKGASFSLNNVMKVKDDGRYDGATSAQDDFAQVAKAPAGDDDSLLD